ncbi:MAG: GIY-YIG nuclease family protein [Proteobacteria bacterium]|nr:GIY-YIG nuclease family protein [Pseudomonadota bacterium]
MPTDPFTIRIFVPDGDPEGVGIIDRMNWTGIGIVFPRSKWADVRKRPDLAKTGVYILVGYKAEDDDLPTIYIGQADGVGNRIESHVQKKDFWDWGVVFTSTSGGLNRAHVTWLEYALVQRVGETKRCHLDNGNAPQEPALSEAEKADTQGFLKEMLQILPLVGLRAFEFPKAIVAPKTTDEPGKVVSHGLDTLIVPAQMDGFEETFLGEDCWYAIRTSGGMLDKIKYIAVYQTAPVSAITHYAPVDKIEPYGEGGKYRVIFSEKAKPIGPIHYGDAPKGSMQGTRYTTIEKLKTATKLTDLGWKK